VSADPVNRVVDPNLRTAAKWIALILLILYCADLFWKLAHWSQYSAGLTVSTVVFALTLRMLFMGFLLWMYLRARRAA
jgi:hypothetical protein